MMDYHKYAQCPYCDREADLIALKLHLRLECNAFAYCPTTEDAIKAYDAEKDCPTWHAT